MPPKKNKIKNERKIDLLEDINKFSTYRFFQADKKPDFKNNYYVSYIIDKNDNKHYIRLADEGYDIIKKGSESTIYPFLMPTKESHVLLSTGKMGRGKGLINSEIIKQLKNADKSLNLYYFCATNKEDDVNLNSKEIPSMKQLNPEEFEGMTDEELSQYFKNSIVVMDDVDKLPKEQKKIIIHIQDHLAVTARKFNTSLFIMGHLPTDYKNTRLLIDELDYYIGFVDSNLNKNRLLGKAYKNMPPRFFEMVKDCIWFFIIFDFNCVITNKRIFFY
ncbi:hypothetical protein EKK58_04335 [Candidatus Dependentiae bacterium]|nr:MAG: hypothetical protein EKK58_04335 [Candidatus Dependentiae bacterium]